MSDQPETRAFSLKAVLKAIAKLPPDQSTTVLQRIPQHLRDEVQRSLAIAWLPYDPYSLAITGSIFAVLSRAQLEEFYLKMASAYLEGPLISAANNAFTKMGAISVKARLRSNSAMWPLATRNAGAWRFEGGDDPNQAATVWQNVPAFFFVHTETIQSAAMMIRSAYVFGKVTGTVETAIDRPAGQVRYLYKWQ